MPKRKRPFQCGSQTEPFTLLVETSMSCGVMEYQEMVILIKLRSCRFAPRSCDSWVMSVYTRTYYVRKKLWVTIYSCPSRPVYRPRTNLDYCMGFSRLYGRRWLMTSSWILKMDYSYNRISIYCFYWWDIVVIPYAAYYMQILHVCIQFLPGKNPESRNKAISANL